MTPHERFLAWMRFAPADRPPLWEWGPWPSTLRRWRREALGPEGDPPELAECDARTTCGQDLWMLPRFPEAVLAEDAEAITRRTARGQVTRTLTDPDAPTMPEHIAFPVATRSDWLALKKRFDPSDPARLPGDWMQRCRRWRREGPVLLFKGERSPSLFGFVRELMGPEGAMLALYDDPWLVHDMMETSAEVAGAVLARASAAAPLTAVFFWEDMCYRAGPLISPAMFREFMSPRYRRVTDVARGLGLDVIMVDSDGDVSELIPLWLDAGVNGVYPMEVAAGMDVVRLRREYGRELLMTGGIDKRALARDRAAIDAELARCVPVAEGGGYIPHLDHAIPHDVPYESFAYYWRRKKALLGPGPDGA